ncbi:MAG TPA: phosphotransferase [Caldilineae bacterium]|nr:phosphotransferase [Caldilineae bacterium]
MGPRMRQPDVQLNDIDAAKLTPIVRQALDNPAAIVTDWETERLSGGIGVGTAVYRISGQAQHGDQTISWSLILKVQLPVPGHDEPSDWAYWKREIEAYRSGWLDDLPGGIAAPRCYGVEERPDGSYWLWLKEVKDDIGPKWPLEHYGVAARHLGQFNGAYLTGEPIPTYPWLSRDWLRQLQEPAGPSIEQLLNAQHLPLVRRFLSEGIGERIAQLWAHRHYFYSLLDHLPQTICHYDATRRNLLAQRMPDGSYQTTLIDWSFVGYGPIGADLALLVKGTISLLSVEISKAQELRQIAFEGYLEGLRDAGWQGDPRLVELSYKTFPGHALAGVGVVKTFAEGKLPWDVRESHGCSVEELIEYWHNAWVALSTTPEEIRELAESLGL